MNSSVSNTCNKEQSLTEIKTGLSNNLRTASVDPPLMICSAVQTDPVNIADLDEWIPTPHYGKSEKQILLEKKISVLEKNLKSHTDLLSRIHATSVRSSKLLSQQETENPQCSYNINYSKGNSGNNIRSNDMSSPKIVNAININQQLSSPHESYIIAEDADGQIELAQAEDVASADSGSLEIYLPLEQNTKIKCELRTSKKITTMKHVTSVPTLVEASTDYHINKKMKLESELQKCYIEKNSEHAISTVLNEYMQNELLKKQINPNNFLEIPKNIYTLQNGSQMVGESNPTAYMNTSAPKNCNNNSSNQNDDGMVIIGPNNTCVPASVYKSLDWNAPFSATRTLLVAAFGRHTLATHSMTGRPSPAFKDQQKPVKNALNPLIISDIVHLVTKHSNISAKHVRSAITTKCADETKLMKLGLMKCDNASKAVNEHNKEN